MHLFEKEITGCCIPATRLGLQNVENRDYLSKDCDFSNREIRLERQPPRMNKVP
jgi:hypothetical protein